VIGWLGLEKCKNTRVGGDLVRGVSGGEKKRTSIALEVITDPSLIFLDEPTTGLDSKSALDVASILRMLARNGRTIVTTIHQPSSEIMSRFDRILCLCEGKIVYDGPPEEIPGYFSAIGYPAPPLTNPADHLMSILNDDDIKIKALNNGQKITKDEVRMEFLHRLETFVKQFEIHKPKL
jgi:ABC-type multidrug transport system ATPase subunit